MTPVFFYGLFMDEDLLREKGFNPNASVIAYLENYGLRIGNRATLVPAPGERAYGTVMELDDVEIKTLYGETSVADYVPEPVTAITAEHIEISAIVYNLPKEKLAGRNDEYLHALIGITRKVGLPEDYIHGLELLESGK